MTQPFSFKIMFKEGTDGQAASSLTIWNNVESNKKVPPRTLLWMLKAGGEIQPTDSAPEKSLVWFFKKTSTLVVDAKTSTCLTLAEFMEKNDAKTVMRHKGYRLEYSCVSACSHRVPKGGQIIPMCVPLLYARRILA